ncbi:MAG: DNA adenine methylase [Planctomycetes bacterium]|nr:DNA adenine methylase [Planctomycetota bacterium]
MTIQRHLFGPTATRIAVRPKGQLLKWVGNKQRVAEEIVSYFPPDLRAYHEPFLGSAAVLATLAPATGYGSDAFPPLIEIWKTLRSERMSHP